MSENEEPDWLAELTKNAMALRQQIEESSEALHWQVDQLVHSAEQFARDAQRTTPGGPVPPFQQRMVGAVGSAMRGLVPAVGYPAGPRGFRGHVRVVPTVTVSGSLTLPPMGFSGQAAVANPPRGLAERRTGQILALVLVAIVTSGLLAVPPRDQAAVGYDLAVVGLALTVALAIWNRGK